jgi:hypothetical protein
MAKKSAKKSKAAAKKPAKAAKGKRTGELRDQEVEAAAGGVLTTVYSSVVTGGTAEGPEESTAFVYGTPSIPYKPQ